MFTAKEKAKEAAREVGYRQWVYSKRVEEGRMTEEEAKKRISVMQEIAEEYGKLAEADEPKLL